MEPKSGAPLHDTPRALGGAPDVHHRNYEEQHAFRFATHPALVPFMHNRYTFQSQTENYRFSFFKVGKNNHMDLTKMLNLQQYFRALEMGIHGNIMNI